MKRLLIISYFFAPKNEIGAVRLSKFTKYLVRLGWEVDVITFKANPFLQLESTIDTTLECEELNRAKIHNLEFPMFLNILYKLRSITGNRFMSDVEKQSIKNTVDKKTISVLQKYSVLPLFKLLVKTKSYTNSGKFINGLKDNYDVIFSSYGPYSMLELGEYYSKKYPKAVYIQDIRDDIIYSHDKNNKFLYSHKSYLERKMLRTADALTIVSKEALDKYSENIQTYEITNGFDAEDRNSENDCKSFNDGYFHIYYGGRIYPKQDVSMLVKAIKNQNLQERVKVHYAGKSYREFIRAFSEENIENVVINHGFVDRTQSLILQEKCNALLLLSWNTKQEQGMITGKVFELLSANRPIICLITGNLDGSRIERIFNDDQYRKCFYYFKGDYEILNLQNYLNQLVNLVNQKNVDINLVDSNKKYSEYSYSSLTKKLDEVFKVEINRKKNKYGCI